MALVVYSRNNCSQCTFTKEFLEKNNIPFETVNVEVQNGALEILRHYGWQTLPVVSIDDELSDQTKTWFGFRPDRLESLL